MTRLIAALALAGAACAHTERLPPAPTPGAADAGVTAPLAVDAGMEVPPPDAGEPAGPPREETMKAANAILEAGLAQNGPEAKGEALAALGLSGRPDARPRLMEALRSDKGELRFAGARGLGLLSDPAAADALTAAWRKEKGWAVRKEIAQAAASCKVKKLVPELKKALAEPQKELQAAVAFALQDLGDKSGSEALLKLGNPERKGIVKEGTDRWARRVLTGEREGDRLLAVRTLAQTGAADDLKPLVEAMASQDPAVRLWAAAGVLRLSR